MNLQSLTSRRNGAIALGAALALAGLITLLITQQIYSQTQSEARRSAQENRQTSAKLSQVLQEKSEITDKLEEYKRLVQRGLIGPEKRMDWIDALVIAREENKLPELKYSIDPQKALDYPGLPTSAEIETMTSPMKLEMALVHEGDLFRVLDGLRRMLPAHFAVEDCSINRVPQLTSSAGTRSQPALLTASCKANVITIRDRRPATQR